MKLIRELLSVFEFSWMMIFFLNENLFMPFFILFYENLFMLIKILWKVASEMDKDFFFFLMNKGKDLNLLSTSNKICIKYKPSMFISILGWGQN